MTDQLRHSATLVDALSSALRRGEHGLSSVPGLLKQLLSEGSWREFVTKRGERVEWDRFSEFVATPPLKGLGASMDLIDRIVGTDDPDLLRLLKAAKSVGRGHRSDLSPSVDSTRSRAAEDAANTSDRLARQAPEEYAAIARGEKTIHAAAVAAGIRPRRVSVRLDRPESAAASLRRHMTSDNLQALARLLTEET